MSTEQTGSSQTGYLLIGSLAIVLVIVLVSRSFTGRVDPYRENNTGQLVGNVIQVSVRNGCGVSGLAGDLTQYLRKNGFDVVEVGDHTSFDEEQSYVYDRIGDLESAKKLAAALGIPEDRVVQDIDLDEYLDATVIIGKDYETLTPFKTTSTPQ